MKSSQPPHLRAIGILEAIATAESPQSPTSIAHRLGWPVQTVYRLCQSLAREGVLERHGRDYFAGRRTMRLAANLAAGAATHTGRHQLLRELAGEVGETVNFVRPEPQGMIYVDRVETNWAFRVELPVGTHVPFHCTASGKLYLAHLDRRKRDRIVATLALERFTANTFTKRDELLGELDRIRGLGHSLDREEFHEDMVAIAVPVGDHEGRFFAALAVHGPTQRFGVETAMRRRELLMDFAGRIEALVFPRDRESCTGDTATSSSRP